MVDLQLPAFTRFSAQTHFIPISLYVKRHVIWNAIWPMRSLELVIPLFKTSLPLVKYIIEFMYGYLHHKGSQAKT